MDQVFGSPGFAPFLSETALPQRLEKWTGLLRFPALRLLMADKRFESRPPPASRPRPGMCPGSLHVSTWWLDTCVSLFRV